MPWNPAQYLEFADARLRPALDLLARIRLDAPRTIVDLGCGTGNVTRLLAERWPQARIVGIDSSQAMLREARAATHDESRFTFVTADLSQWLPDHAALFARVATMVAPGGVLAVQMPDNFRAASHTLIADIARSERWRATLGGIVREPPVAAPPDYFAWLSALMSKVDIWRTEYLQVLDARKDGEHPVAAWTKGTWLVPFLEALGESDRAKFLREYMDRLAVAYPPCDDGRTLFSFRRLFIVANR